MSEAGARQNLMWTPKMSLCFSLSETVELLNRRRIFLKLKLGSMKAGGTTTRSGSGSSGGGANGGASGAPVDEEDVDGVEAEELADGVVAGGVVVLSVSPTDTGGPFNRDGA